MPRHGRCLLDVVFDGWVGRKSMTSRTGIKAYPACWKPIRGMVRAQPGTSDLASQLVTTLVDGLSERGARSVSIDASNPGSGLHFYRPEARGQVRTRKMVLQKQATLFREFGEFH